MESESPSFVILYLSMGVGNCVIFMLALYNLVAFVGVMRNEDPEGASGLAKSAWGLGCLSAVFFPCSPVLGIVAMILSKVEVGRVYRDESPLSSATPARMGSVNGGVALLVWLLVTVGTAINFLL